MKHERPFVLSCILVIASSMIIPAYADVLSFKTDKTFYGKTSTIVFSGTVEEDDYGELVTIVIDDPSGEFVLLIQAFPDVDNKFQKSVDVGKFYTAAGIYNATAFITNKTNGKIVDFDIEKQRLIVIPPSEPKSEPEQSQEDETVSNTPTDQSSGTVTNEKSIQEKIKERIEAAKKLKELQSMPSQASENQVNQTTDNADVENTISGDNSNDAEDESEPLPETTTSFDPNLLYIALSIAGAGGAGAVVYSMRNKSKPRDYSSYFSSSEKTEVSEKPSAQSEDDYALMILKNRLAKGEITIDEFNELKKALKEP